MPYIHTNPYDVLSMLKGISYLPKSFWLLFACTGARKKRGEVLGRFQAAGLGLRIET